MFDQPSIDASQFEPLPPSFFARNALAVAPRLIGKGLVVGRGKMAIIVEIVEVEAYMDRDDPASHSHAGETRRNRSMFACGGTAYVYLSYGMHYCMNVVTGARGSGQAVLLRAAAPLQGWAQMVENRGWRVADVSQRRSPLVLNGPGKLTQATGITLAHDGRMLDKETFKLIDLGRRYQRSAIASSPRIGISKHVDAPWRFFLKGSMWVSRRLS